MQVEDLDTQAGETQRGSEEHQGQTGSTADSELHLGDGPAKSQVDLSDPRKDPRQAWRGETGTPRRAGQRQTLGRPQKTDRKGR